MKKTKILYWVFTALFGAFMLFSAIPDVMLSAEAVTFMKQLGYPNYFTVFIGVAKVLGVIAILIPGYPRIKEWAYAGLFFDLIGAVYSMLSAMPFNAQMSFMLLPFILGILSYVFYHKLNTAKN
ncbi:DoxX family protein [Ferruginibacter sp. SUN106]|uniref:DoxX family protein n=1 Tax=Ferruginibacter sp. SUN106 TaxID=2978348 RepID=UPI003D36824D